MSLLMEALRKAEEAKSKASAKEDNDGLEKEDSLSLSSEPSSAEESGQQSDDESKTIKAEQEIPELEPLPEQEQAEAGPVIINPDPDEEETLASHISNAEQEDSLEKIEFSTELRLEEKEEETESKDKVVIAPQDSSDEDSADDQDNLSLLQSSYFTRTQKAGGKNFSDIKLDDTEDNDLHTTANSVSDDNAPQNQQTPEAVQDSLSADSDKVSPAREKAGSRVESPSSAGKNSKDVAPALKSPGKSSQAEQAKAREKENRSSAGSLFLAKEASQKSGLKKYKSVAAVLLIIPVAGIAYWFYSSLSSTSSMQFDMPVQNGLADRGFFGSEGNADTGLPAAVADNDVSAAPVIENSESDSLVAQATQSGSNDETVQGAPAVASNQIITLDTPEQPEEQLIVAPPQETAATTLVETPAPAQNTVTLVSTAPPSTRAQTSSGLNFVKTDVVVTVNPDLDAAYASYQAGDLVQAGRLYQQVLQKEPNNRDAMLGLASIYMTQGSTAFAQNLYARLLELNPRDPLAMAGLLEVTMRDDPVQQESALKSLIRDYSQLAPLSFALGNLYASQNRWTEAQNAYFDALLSAKSSNSGAVNPDYAFNLAVSLERVNQLPAALDFYREAKEFSRFAAPGFNPALLEQRLNYLEQRLP